MRFPGQWEDAVWANIYPLYYNLNRWYQAGSGSYTSIDPLDIRSGGEVHPYDYVASNPIRGIDPLGLAGCSFGEIEQCQQDCAARRRRFKDCTPIKLELCFGLFGYITAIECACTDWQRGCQPCPPPPPPRIDFVPPSRPHFPCKGSHWTFFRYDQGPPPTCICRLSQQFGGCID